MSPFLAIPIQESAEHYLLAIGAITGTFAAWKAFRTAKQERDKAIVERAEQRELLERVAKEFAEDHGESLMDRVKIIEASIKNLDEAIKAHHKQGDTWARENTRAHNDLYAKLERLAERHAAGRAP